MSFAFLLHFVRTIHSVADVATAAAAAAQEATRTSVSQHLRKLRIIQSHSKKFSSAIYNLLEYYFSTAVASDVISSVCPSRHSLFLSLSLCLPACLHFLKYSFPYSPPLSLPLPFSPSPSTSPSPPPSPSFLFPSLPLCSSLPSLFLSISTSPCSSPYSPPSPSTFPSPYLSPAFSSLKMFSCFFYLAKNSFIIAAKASSQ